MEGWGWGQEYYTVNVNVRWDGEGFGWGKIWKRRREIKVAGEVGGLREVAVGPGGLCMPRWLGCPMDVRSQLKLKHGR